jgi:plasmid stability protein
MTTVTIRNLKPRLKSQLRQRAARNGRSLQAELRLMLGQTPRTSPEVEPNLAEAIRRLFEPLGGVELEPHPPVVVREPPKFD